MKPLLPLTLALSVLCACQANKNAASSDPTAPEKKSDGQSCAQSAKGFPFGKELSYDGETVSWTIVIRKLSSNDYEVTGRVSPQNKSDLAYWGGMRQKLMLFCNNELIEEFYVKGHMHTSKDVTLQGKFTTDKPFNQVFLKLGGTLYMRL